MKNIILLFTTILFFASCKEGALEQVITIDLPEHTSKLASTTHFSATEETLEVWVSHSLGTLDTVSYTNIENATVQLFYNENLLHDLDFWEENKSYIAINSNPLESGKYRLEITAPDYGTVSAEQTLPVAVPITSVEYEKEGTVSVDGERVDQIKVVFSDPPGEDNYYEIRAFFTFQDPNDPFVTYEQMIYLDSNDPIVEYGYDGLLLTDASIAGNEYSVFLYHYDNFGGEFQPASLTVELVSITEDRYLYNKSLSSYWETKDNPFAEPVVPHNNLENGYGVFTMENISEFVVEF